MADENLVIKIGAEAKEFQDAIDGIKKQTADLEGQLTGIAKVSGAVFAGLVASAGIAIAEFKKTEEITNSLSLAIRNQGLDANKLSKTYDDLSKAVSKKTKFDDDAVKSGFTVLQSFLGQQEISADLADSLVNLAAKTGSVEEAAQILGRGIQGNTKGLKQFGITVDESATKSERLQIILGKVDQNFGGLAESQAKGLGSLNLVTKAVDDLAKAIGAKLAPIVSEAALKFANFINSIAENEALVSTIVEVGKFAAVIAGAILGITSAAIAVVKLNQAFEIAAVGLKLLGLSVRGVVAATGIGLLVLLAAEIYLNWDKLAGVFHIVQVAIINLVTNTKEALAGFGTLAGGVALILTGNLKTGFETLKNGVAQLKETLTKGLDDINKEGASKDKERESDRAKNAKEAADERLANEQRIEEASQAARAAGFEAQRLELENASKQIIDLKKQEAEIQKNIAETSNSELLEILKQRLETNKTLQTSALVEEAERQATFNESILESDKQFKALSAEQQTVFLEENQAKLAAQIDTETTARRKLAATTAEIQIQSNNRFLAEQAKFGTAYASINQTLYSSEVGSAREGASQLAGLQNSKNATLKAIGKGAAITQIGIDSAKGAMSVYANFQSAIPFPPVSIPLGIAAAAAILAYGGEQVATVLAAAEGGVVTGGIQGQDSVPALLSPGELVVPNRSFDEVVGAVASARSGITNPAGPSATATSGAASTGAPTIAIAFDGPEAQKVITARRVEARALGTLREATI